MTTGTGTRKEPEMVGSALPVLNEDLLVVGEAVEYVNLRGHVHLVIITRVINKNDSRTPLDLVLYCPDGRTVYMKNVPYEKYADESTMVWRRR